MGEERSRKFGLIACTATKTVWVAQSPVMQKKETKWLKSAVVTAVVLNNVRYVPESELAEAIAAREEAERARDNWRDNWRKAGADALVNETELTDRLAASEARAKALEEVLRDGVKLFEDADIDGSTEEAAVDLAFEYAEQRAWVEHARAALSTPEAQD